MASVKVTDKLVRDVNGNINKLFIGRYDEITTRAAAAVTAKELSRVRTNIETFDAADVVLTLPDGKRYVNAVNSVYVHVNGVVNNTRFIAFQMEDPISFPENMSTRYDPYKLQYTEGSAFKCLHDLADEYCAVEDEEAKLKDALVEGVLKKCVSLNQAVTLWPSIVDFCDDATRKRLAHKPAKAKRQARESVSIDDDTRAALVIARMQQK